MMTGFGLIYCKTVNVINSWNLSIKGNNIRFIKNAEIVLFLENFTLDEHTLLRFVKNVHTLRTDCIEICNSRYLKKIHSLRTNFCFGTLSQKYIYYTKKIHTIGIVDNNYSHASHFRTPPSAIEFFNNIPTEQLEYIADIPIIYTYTNFFSDSLMRHFSNTVKLGVVDCNIVSNNGLKYLTNIVDLEIRGITPLPLHGKEIGKITFKGLVCLTKLNVLRLNNFVTIKNLKINKLMTVNTLVFTNCRIPIDELHQNVYDRHIIFFHTRCYYNNNDLIHKLTNVRSIKLNCSDAIRRMALRKNIDIRNIKNTLIYHSTKNF